MPPDQLYALTAEDAALLRRILDAAREASGQPPGTSAPRRPPARLYLGKTSGSISAASGTTPGSGTVTLYQLDAGAMTATSATVTAYNWTASATGSDVMVIVAQDPWGTYWLVSEDCT